MDIQSQWKDVSEVAMCLSTEVFIKEMSVFVGVEALLLHVVVVLVRSS